MTPDLLCDSLRRTLPELFECLPTRREAVRVHTPLMYPDGGGVDVFVVERNGELIVTDHGDAVGWLGMQSVSDKLTAHQRSLIDDICRVQGVKIEGARLVARCDSLVTVADAIHRVALAAVRVSDISFTFRTHGPPSVADAVDKWLRDHQFGVQRRVKERGLSERKWTIDYRVDANRRISLVFLLSTSTSGASRRIAERVTSACVDLQHLTVDRNDLAFVSLFDDTHDVWRGRRLRAGRRAFRNSPVVATPPGRANPHAHLTRPPPTELGRTRSNKPERPEQTNSQQNAAIPQPKPALQSPKRDSP